MDNNSYNIALSGKYDQATIAYVFIQNSLDESLYGNMYSTSGTNSGKINDPTGQIARGTTGRGRLGEAEGYSQAGVRDGDGPGKASPVRHVEQDPGLQQQAPQFRLPPEPGTGHTARQHARLSLGRPLGIVLRFCGLHGNTCGLDWIWSRSKNTYSHNMKGGTCGG